MEFFNYDLYLKIKAVRRERNLPVYTERYLPFHSLKGKTICDLHTTKRKYIVKDVIKYWYKGYYIDLVCENGNGNILFLSWESINCYDQLVLNTIEKNRTNFRIENKNNFKSLGEIFINKYPIIGE